MPGLAIALEVGTKKTFASAIEWPGWARSGRDEAAAIEALLAYTDRYRRVVARHRLGFKEPDGTIVVERLKGTAITDFGAPIIAPEADERSLDDKELKRQVAILGASWDELLRIVEAADGKELQKGPSSMDLAKVLDDYKDADAKAMAFAVSDEVPEQGPRGGTLWTPRYFVRRAAWHILDHAWEIEDKVID